MIGRQKRCESCGDSFECRGLWFCWCRSVTLTDQTRAQLRERFDDCLCPRCLNERSRTPDAHVTDREAPSDDDAGRADAAFSNKTRP